MFQKLGSIKEKYEAIGQSLMDPDIVSDNQKYASLMREYKNLSPIVEKYEEYSKCLQDMNEAKELLDAGGLDKDFREMAQMQFEENRDKIEEISAELKILLLPKDPNDDKNVIVEIRGGAGGEEAALFACMLRLVAGKLKFSTKIPPSLAVIRKSASELRVREHIPALSSKAEFIEFSAFLKPRLAAEFTHLPLLLLFSLRLRMLKLI